MSWGNCIGVGVDRLVQCPYRLSGFNHAYLIMGFLVGFSVSEKEANTAGKLTTDKG